MSPLHSALRLTLALFITGFASPCLAMQESLDAQKREISISDTIFRSAVNSPGYLVVKKSDWEAYKKLWNDSISSQAKRLEVAQAAVQNRLDSLKNAAAQPIQTQNQEEPIETSKPVDPINPILLGALLLFLVANGLGLLFFFLRKNKSMKDQNERLNLLENELSDYKTASIQRERKLMRELIDTRHALEEEKARQSSNED